MLTFTHCDIEFELPCVFGFCIDKPFKFELDFFNVLITLCVIYYALCKCFLARFKRVLVKCDLHLGRPLFNKEERLNIFLMGDF